MSSTVVVDRGALGGTTASFGSPAPGTGANWCVVPRCEIEFEKCAGGFKIHCRCEDDVACATLQNLCKQLAGGVCSCCCTLSGVTVCQCNLTCGMTRCEYTADGCCITCLTGDEACCSILQCCCDAMACCVKEGGCCYVCFNGTPVCCGCCPC